MPKISLRAFSGLSPSIAARLLSDSGAQIASDCDLSSGSLEPFNQPLPVNTLSSNNQVNSIYQYNNSFDNNVWLDWAEEVNVVRAPIANDATARIYYTDGISLKVTNTDKLALPTPYWNVGVDFPVGLSAVVDAVGSNPVNRVYVITYLTELGEESLPSDATPILSVGVGGQVTLTLPNTLAPINNVPYSKIYIYRSISGTSLTNLQFVGEVLIGATTYVDSKEDTELSELIPSRDYDKPPANLFGLTELSGGILVAFTESEVCFSEPYQPHAWPIKYRLASKDKIIGGGVFGNRIVVCTDLNPFMVIGNHPDSMSKSKIADILPCVSAKGIVAMSGGVVFPTPDGLYYIGSGGIRNLTEDVYFVKTWTALNPEEFTAVEWNNKYIAFNSSNGFIFDLQKPTNHSVLSYAATATHVGTDKELYFSEFKDTSNQIYKFNSSNLRETLKWKSKRFSVRKALSFSAGQIFTTENGFSDAEIAIIQANYDAIALTNITIFDLGDIGGEINADEINALAINKDQTQTLPSIPSENKVTVRFYADDIKVFESIVGNAEIFRMPIGYKANEFEVEFETPLIIDEVSIATSVKEL